MPLLPPGGVSMMLRLVQQHGDLWHPASPGYSSTSHPLVSGLAGEATANVLAATLRTWRDSRPTDVRQDPREPGTGSVRPHWPGISARRGLSADSASVPPSDCLGH